MLQGITTQEFNGNEDSVLIKTENLTKIYKHKGDKILKLKKDTTTAVDGIDLTIRKGVHGFLGPNGAGKTSTMKMIIGAIPITDGSAKVCGYSAGSLNAKKKIGFLPQHVEFYYDMQGKEFLIHCGRLFGMTKKEAENEATELLDEFDLQEAEMRRIETYSGGMKQRLGLAAALIGKPEILILDEPTSDLDPIGRDKIISYVKKISKQATIFVSSHVLSEVEEMCDTVTVIDHGKLLLTDTIANLKRIYQSTNNMLTIDTSNNSSVFQALKGKEFIEKIWVDDKTKTIRILPKNRVKLQNAIANLMLNGEILLNKFTQEEFSLKDIFLEVINKEGFNNE
ncbi:MAG: ABC transporter ATP-binding protein [Promethearchaeota archaeon]|nr:MAG: ABC transporter ATP-binding protein [Candidatus Lokiarchaeota archaeon]